jgi:hypothetical protein
VPFLYPCFIQEVRFTSYITKKLSDDSEYKAICPFPLGCLEQKLIKFRECDKNITKGKVLYFTATNIKYHAGILS